MFWKYNNSSSAQLETLLAKEDVTIQEVMDCEDIINECKVQNKNLIEFLLRPGILDHLVTLTVQEPSPELDERVRFKYPNIACELLTCDVPSLNERLASDEVLLEKLYVFLENEAPLNPLLASYFSKIMGALIAKKTEQNWLSYQLTCLQVLDFLKAKDAFVALLLKHIGTSAIMDLTLKLMTQVEGVEIRQNILNWLDSQRIVQQLVTLLNPNIDKEKHYNVAQLLCDFIKPSIDTHRNSMERTDPDPLLNSLESCETMSLLLNEILSNEKTESSIVGGIQVILTLYQTSLNKVNGINSDNVYSSGLNDETVDIEQKQRVIYNMTQVISKRVKDFHELLLNPPRQDPILTTVGTLDPPLGNVRLQVVKLFGVIISSNNSNLLDEMVAVGTFPVLIDLFFKYPWNNFLHTQVETCLIAALKTYSSEENEEHTNALCKHLLINCKLIERILDAWKENDEKQENGKGLRQGYMGHLISIVNKIVELCSSTSLGQYLKDYVPDVAKSLDEFKETTLAKTNEVQDTLLGGVHPSNAIEANVDYGELPFPQSSAMQQQMFSQYQMQHLTAQYIEGYSGFNDDAFNDGDDALQTIDHRSDVNFDLSEGDFAQQQEIFKQVCAQNINTLDDADDVLFDDRDATFQTVIEKQCDKNATCSSDSDDESPTGDENMDIDRESWSGGPKPTESTIKISNDPWNDVTMSKLNSELEAVGWADFNSASFETEYDGATAKWDKSPSEQPTRAEKAEKSEKVEKVDTLETETGVKETKEEGRKEVEEKEAEKKIEIKGAVEEVPKESIPDLIKACEKAEVASPAAGDCGNSGDAKKEVNSSSEPSISIEGNSHSSNTGSAGNSDKGNA